MTAWEARQRNPFSDQAMKQGATGLVWLDRGTNGSLGFLLGYISLNEQVHRHEWYHIVQIHRRIWFDGRHACQQAYLRAIFCGESPKRRSFATASAHVTG